MGPNDKLKQLAELKKIAAIKVDREKHQLSTIKDELAQLAEERKALQNRMGSVAETRESEPAALINAQSYLDALSNHARHLGEAQREAHNRTEAQRERIKQALASKIRIDGMKTP
jgi:flagellar biosynthesis chaperone FliJ